MDQCGEKTRGTCGVRTRVVKRQEETGIKHRWLVPVTEGDERQPIVTHTLYFFGINSGATRLARHVERQQL